MLFLAVFCGFLAEYQLEHIIENQREKKYMQSFIYDLENDTLNLKDGFPRKEERINAIDSLFLFFQSYPDAEIVSGSIVRQMRRTLFDRHYRRNSVTIDQLKNAGGLRLIRRKSVADSIAAYDLQWQRAEFWREGYITLQEKGKDLLHKILPADKMLFIYLKGGNFQDWKLIDNIQVKLNKAHLNEFLNFMGNQKTYTKQDKEAYEQIEQSAERLIVLIKNEYKLK